MYYESWIDETHFFSPRKWVELDQYRVTGTLTNYFVDPEILRSFIERDELARSEIRRNRLSSSTAIYRFMKEKRN